MLSLPQILHKRRTCTEHVLSAFVLLQKHTESLSKNIPSVLSLRTLTHNPRPCRASTPHQCARFFNMINTHSMSPSCNSKDTPHSLHQCASFFKCTQYVLELQFIVSKDTPHSLPLCRSQPPVWYSHLPFSLSVLQAMKSWLGRMNKDMFW